MKLSWSQKLFLKINKSVGKRSQFDRVMYFFGQWLIFILAVCTGIALFFDVWRTGSWYTIVVGAIAFVLTLSLSYLTALIFPHPRPARELPNVKQLLHPIESWKSFPSDHTIAVTFFTILIADVSDETIFEFWAVFLYLIAAVLVMCGRVYGGVHYPRDILGGILFAVVGMTISVAICSRYFFAL